MNKSAALRIRLNSDLHQDFLKVCQSQDISASQVLRQYMRVYIDDHISELQPDLFESLPTTKNMSNSN